MRVDFTEEPNKIDAVVCDKREFIFDDTPGQFPIRLAAQTKVIDVDCFETGVMSDSNQRLMQAFVNQEPHAPLSRELNG